MITNYCALTECYFFRDRECIAAEILTPNRQVVRFCFPGLNSADLIGPVEAPDQRCTLFRCNYLNAPLP
jgi:hypothetical protein